MKNIGKAPYNFVPLPEMIINRYDSAADLPTHDASREEDRTLLSGEITFNIVAESPILVADASGDGPRQFVKNADGTYEIPGSTLRGLIRSAVSVLSLSDWTERIDEERFFYRSVAESSSTIGKHYKHVLDVRVQRVNNKQEAIPQNVKAGFIAKMMDGNYCIYHAKTDGGRQGKTYYKVNDGNLAVRKDAFRNNVTKGFIVEDTTFSIDSTGKVVKLFQEDTSFKGHLLYSGFIKTGKTNKVSAYLINEIDTEKTPVHVELQDVKAYQADLKYRLSKFPGNQRERMRQFFELPERPGIEYAKPCFYLEYDGVTYFGFTPFLRLLFPFSTKDLLPDHILNKKPGIDYTAAMFGFTNREDAGNYASRLHFHGATVKNNVQPMEPISIQPGSPRASAYRFYLNQDGQEGNDYYTYLTRDTTIRGMKQYWIKAEDRPVFEKRNNKYSTELELLPKHTTFQAKITFDQLHEDELGLLLWALRGPQHQQLGMGKPFGYGIVSFEMMKCFVTNNEKMYQDLTSPFEIGYEQIDMDSYIDTYKKRMKESMKENGYADADDFELEDLESIQIYLAMKEKSKLKIQDMRYTGLKSYPKVTLPTAEQLLKDPTIYEKAQRAGGMQTAKANRAPVRKPNQKGGRHQRKQQGNDRGKMTHNPFADLLKDYRPKN